MQPLKDPAKLGWDFNHRQLYEHSRTNPTQLSVLQAGAIPCFLLLPHCAQLDCPPCPGRHRPPSETTALCASWLAVTPMPTAGPQQSVSGAELKKPCHTAGSHTPLALLPAHLNFKLTFQVKLHPNSTNLRAGGSR